MPIYLCFVSLAAFVTIDLNSCDLDRVACKAKILAIRFFTGEVLTLAS